MNDAHWHHAFRTYADSSFVELLRRESPHLMPTPTAGPAAPAMPTPE